MTSSVISVPRSGRRPAEGSRSRRASSLAADDERLLALADPEGSDVLLAFGLVAMSYGQSSSGGLFLAARYVWPFDLVLGLPTVDITEGRL
jgi:hypothetical protein